MFLKKSVLLPFIIFFITGIHAQILPEHNIYHFQHFTAKTGLPSNNVFCVLQDEGGLIWIGTDNGLTRFDGNDFRTYYHRAYDSTSLSGNYIVNLFEDSKKRIWIA